MLKTNNNENMGRIRNIEDAFNLFNYKLNMEIHITLSFT